MGTATITTEPDLEPRVEKLQLQLIKYKELYTVSRHTSNHIQMRTLQKGQAT